jgi:hypothetical protein
MATDPQSTAVPRRDGPVPRLLLGGLALLLLVALATPPDARGIPNRTVTPGRDDLTLFRAVAARVGRGEPYYPTMADELTTRGYPTGSVANWRTPLHLVLVGRAPVLMRGLLMLLGVLVAAGTAYTFRAGPWLPVLILQLGATGALGRADLLVMPEPLAGALIALSVLASLRELRWPSVALGVAALFVREIAVPYAGVRLVYALWTRQWREAIGWTAGIGVYVLYAIWHVSEVRHAMPPHPTWHPFPWLAFGGLRFVLATVRSNTWLTVLPWWITPMALVAAFLGAWRAAPIVGLTIAAYVVAFAMIGHPFNWYWGWVPGMLFPLAWAHVDTGIALPLWLAPGRRRRLVTAS